MLVSALALFTLWVRRRCTPSVFELDRMPGRWNGRGRRLEHAVGRRREPGLSPASCGQRRRRHPVHGGGSGRPRITRWLWSGRAAHKDNVTNAYAASYTTRSTRRERRRRPDLYFGLDRFSTAGSAQVGFWFLQDKDFGLTTRPREGFRVQRSAPGHDVLVQSNFTNGGVVSNPRLQVGGGVRPGHHHERLCHVGAL